MGVSCMSSSTYDNSGPTIIDPYKFKVIRVDTRYRPFCILLLKYDCLSFNGYKLAVYNCHEIEDRVINRISLDPHFSKNEPEITPIARFRPEKEGFEMALTTCKTLYNKLTIEEIRSKPTDIVSIIEEEVWEKINDYALI